MAPGQALNLQAQTRSGSSCISRSTHTKLLAPCTRFQARDWGSWAGERNRLSSAQNL